MSDTSVPHSSASVVKFMPPNSCRVDLSFFETLYEMKLNEMKLAVSDVPISAALDPRTGQLVLRGDSLRITASQDSPSTQFRGVLKNVNTTNVRCSARVWLFVFGWSIGLECVACLENGLRLLKCGCCIRRSSSRWTSLPCSLEWQPVAGTASCPARSGLWASRVFCVFCVFCILCWCWFDVTTCVLILVPTGCTISKLSIRLRVFVLRGP